MSSNRKHTAVIIILLFALGILYLGRTYILPVLTAVILAFLLFPIYKLFLIKTKRETLSGALVIIFFLLIIIVPVTFLSSIFISQINSFDFSEEALLDYELRIEEILDINIPVVNSIESFKDRLKQDAQQYARTFISITTNVALFFFIMIFTMFYLLVEHKFFLYELKKLLPFSEKNSEYLISESGKMTKAILIGQVLTAVVQGLLGMFSFIIAGIEGAFFWGVIMMILSLIPVVGAFLIWLPAGVFLLFEGNIGMGIFVLVWGAVVVSQIDNIIRPKLVNQFADIHPLETFLGIFIGLSAFGMIGVVLGPLLLSLFRILVVSYKKEYSQV